METLETCIFWPCVHPPTYANEQHDLRGYWTKVHRIFTRHRWIIVDVKQQSALRYSHLLYNSSTNNKGRYANLSPSRTTNRLLCQCPLNEIYQNFFIRGVSAAIHVVKRLSIVEWQGRQLKKVTSAKHKPTGIARWTNNKVRKSDQVTKPYATFDMRTSP